MTVTYPRSARPPFALDDYFLTTDPLPSAPLYFDYLRLDRLIKKVPKTGEEIVLLEYPPILRFPKTKYHLIRTGEILNLSGSTAYQKPLKHFISKGMMLTGNNVERICFADNRKLISKHVLKVLSSCPNTRYLDIANTNLKADCFRGRAFPRVEEVTIAGYNLMDLENIVQSFPNLQALNIVRDTKLSLQDFMDVLDTYPAIKYIKLQDSNITRTDSRDSKEDKEDFLREVFFDQEFRFD